MWIYNRTLQFPVKIKTRNPEMAKVIINPESADKDKKDK